jgi:hypothetical protein
MCIITLISVILIILLSVCYVGKFPAKYERFCALYVPNHLISKNKRNGTERNGTEMVVNEGKQCPFVEHYDGHLHDVLANLRRLDGTIQTHPQYIVPVNLFARKYWVKASTPVLG